MMQKSNNFEKVANLADIPNEVTSYLETCFSEKLSSVEPSQDGFKKATQKELFTNVLASILLQRSIIYQSFQENTSVRVSF